MALYHLNTSQEILALSMLGQPQVSKLASYQAWCRYRVCVCETGEEESRAGGHGEGAVCILRTRAGARQPFRGRHSEGLPRTEEGTAYHRTGVSSVSASLPLQPGSSLSPCFFWSYSALARLPLQWLCGRLVCQIMLRVGQVLRVFNFERFVRFIPPDSLSGAAGREELHTVAASVTQVLHLCTFFATYRHP